MKNLHLNVNDNNIMHRLYMGSAEHLPYVPAARYLIKKYVCHYWKNDCNDIEFIDMELSLCGYLEMPTESAFSRELKVKWIARTLNVQPMLLLNDQDLPF